MNLFGIGRKQYDPNSIVIRKAEQGGISFEFVKDPPGKPWLFGGRYVNLLKQVDGHLEEYEPPDEIICLPDKLYRGLHWEPARRLLAYKSTLFDKLNLGIGIALVGILAFIIFLIISG